MSSGNNPMGWSTRLTLIGGAFIAMVSLVSACGDDKPRSNCPPNNGAMVLQVAIPRVASTPKPPTSRPNTRPSTGSTGGSTSRPTTGTTPKQTPGTTGSTSRPTIKPLSPAQTKTAKQALKSKQRYKSPYNHKFYDFHAADYFDNDVFYDMYNPFDPRAWADSKSPYYGLNEVPDMEAPTSDEPYAVSPTPTC